VARDTEAQSGGGISHGMHGSSLHSVSRTCFDGLVLILIIVADMWWIGLALFLICIVEVGRVAKSWDSR